jgi:hypothetical protein
MNVKKCKRKVISQYLFKSRPQQSKYLMPVK